MNKERVSGCHVKFKQLMHFYCQMGELLPVCCKMALLEEYKQNRNVFDFFVSGI